MTTSLHASHPSPAWKHFRIATKLMQFLIALLEQPLHEKDNLGNVTLVDSNLARRFEEGNGNLNIKKYNHVTRLLLWPFLYTSGRLQ